MKKIMTIVGTRPDIIRLSEIIKKLDKYFNHVFVHTGQNFDSTLRDQFFIDFDLRSPDYQFNLEEKSVGFKFIGEMFIKIQEVLIIEKPDAVLILGDVNSALASYVCKQMHIPVFHMEAGNRCYDDNVPEEVNRRIVDSCSEYLLTYTQRGREQLLKEGYDIDKIIVIGNPITEVLTKYQGKKNQKEVLDKYGIEEKKYVLSTLHRTENITNESSLRNICKALNEISLDHQIILSVHPKLSTMLEKFNVSLLRKIKLCKPFGFKEFLILMENAEVVLTDSGTVPEECCILKVPCVSMRDSTERPELVENNSMILSGTKYSNILDSFSIVKNLTIGDLPQDYKDTNVSDKIVKILMR